MKCQNCGSEIKNGTAFCANCGAPVQVQQNVAPVQNQPMNQSAPGGQYYYGPQQPKKGGGLKTLGIVLLIILLLVGLAAGGYFGYKALTKDKEETKEKEKDKDKDNDNDNDKDKDKDNDNDNDKDNDNDQDEDEDEDDPIIEDDNYLLVDNNKIIPPSGSKIINNISFEYKGFTVNLNQTGKQTVDMLYSQKEAFLKTYNDMGLIVSRFEYKQDLGEKYIYLETLTEGVKVSQIYINLENGTGLFITMVNSGSLNSEYPNDGFIKDMIRMITNTK